MTAEFTTAEARQFLEGLQATEAEAREARNLLAEALRARDGESSTSLVDCARRIIELLETAERIKAAIQAEANQALERYRDETALLKRQLELAVTKALAEDGAIKTREQAHDALFDHSGRTTKAFKPELGFCVCRHCKDLPEHETVVQTVEIPHPIRQLDIDLATSASNPDSLSLAQLEDRRFLDEVERIANTPSDSMPAAFEKIGNAPLVEDTILISKETYDSLFRCENCDPSFGCWTGMVRCCKLPPSIPEQIEAAQRPPSTEALLRELLDEAIGIAIAECCDETYSSSGKQRTLDRLEQLRTAADTGKMPP